MLTKDPHQRPDWSEIFGYEIDDFGEITVKKSMKGSLKTSATGSLNSLNMGSIVPRLGESPYLLELNKKKDDSLNPR